MENCFGFKNIGFGMGLRTKHFSHILENQPKMDWFEIISENFMDTDGRPKRVLEKICENYPVIMHGVSMSVGSTDPLDMEYLKKLKALAGWVKPPWVSDHLCWTGINKTDTHDLLPVPYTEEALTHIVERIKRVQDILDRPLVLENPSTYLEFKHSQMPEWEFLSSVAEKADCALLLDINNVFVSCFNHGWDEKTYIDSLPMERVVQIHLAGHEDHGTHVIDTHEGPIIDAVWTLYHYVISKYGQISTMVEWDTNIPDFAVVAEEVEKARQYASLSDIPNNIPSHLKEKINDNVPLQDVRYDGILPPMHEAIVSGDAELSDPDSWIQDKENFPAREQLSVYINGYRYRLFDAISEDFPAARHCLGDELMNKLIDEYVEATPSHYFSLAHYVKKFPGFSDSRDYLQDRLFERELIQLETAITTIFDWEETPPLTQDDMKSINPESFFSTTVKSRKALALYVFEYPVSEYYRMFKSGEMPDAPKLERNYVAIYRHEDQMHRLKLEEEEYGLLTLLFNGAEIGEAIEKLMEDESIDVEILSQKLQEWLGRWVVNGLLAA